MTRRALLSNMIAPVSQLEARDASAVELDPEKRYLIVVRWKNLEGLMAHPQEFYHWLRQRLHEIGVEAVVYGDDQTELDIYELEASK